MSMRWMDSPSDWRKTSEEALAAYRARQPKARAPIQTRRPRPRRITDAAYDRIEHGVQAYQQKMRDIWEWRKLTQAGTGLIQGATLDNAMHNQAVKALNARNEDFWKRR